jgi:hypothetical protein
MFAQRMLVEIESLACCGKAEKSERAIENAVLISAGNNQGLVVIGAARVDPIALGFEIGWNGQVRIRFADLLHGADNGLAS